jgi:prepilin-type N-terminal cleavage/methylation domain-containing protein
MAKLASETGYSLIELVLVLVIIGVLAGIGLQTMTAATITARTEETRAELEQLAVAIVGDPSLAVSGARTDFGYVGDIGALPVNLDALAVNPGGYTTWDGPYTRDPFSNGGPDYAFKLDAWGRPYSYYGGVTIQSTGGPTSLTRQLANTVADLVANGVVVIVTDLSGNPPGSDYTDSVIVRLTCPNGAGGLSSSDLYPSAGGRVQFNAVPIGLRDLEVIYLPSADTLKRKVTVYPGEDTYLEISLGEDLW